MENTAHRAIAIVGVGAVLPDAPNVPAFWENVKNSRYSISEVTPDRWDPASYYDPDQSAPDKTYSKIGGWVREYPWDPMKWRLPIPPRVVEAMDVAQKWAIACTREALEDYGYPKRPLDPDRTAVILGNAMAGERHYLTSLRVFFPEYARELAESASFAALPVSARNDITRELHDRMGQPLPEITEDSMPGELANCIAGRIANIFNFHGPNYVWMRRVPRRWRPSVRRRKAWSRTILTSRLAAGLTATWALRPSSSSARSARSRRPALAPTPREPTASSWAKARRSFC